MIRYIELSPAANVTFNSGKVITTHVSEGAQIAVDTVLFTIDSQDKKIEVLSTAEGKIQEMLVFNDDIIHKKTSLLILETYVDDPISPDNIESIDNKNKDTKITRSIQTNTLNNSSEKDIMSEIKVPDLGGADAVEVIEILVNVGDVVEVDDALISVESDKASMDIPASTSGKIEEITINVGDNVSEGDVIFKISGDSTSPKQQVEESKPEKTIQPAIEKEQPVAKPQTQSSISQSTSDIQVTIPDLGGASDVDVIEILVAVGDSIAEDQAIITVESDKASMDVPSSHAGVITALNIAVGDKVNEGDPIIIISGTTTENTTTATDTVVAPSTTNTSTKQTSIIDLSQPTEPAQIIEKTLIDKSTPNSHASPSIRRLARELGVDLSKVVGSARKKRITKSDVKAYAKSIITSGSNTATDNTAPITSGIPEIPAQDFSKFGEIEVQALNKIKRITASHLHRSWVNIPHVTHSDESNIASLEEFRKTLNSENAKKKEVIKLSPLAFIVKVVVKALQEFPQFNSSLENGGQNLILKNYFNIGIAVETPNGLVVPVIKDADKMNISQIAQTMNNIAQKARDGKLTANDMQGGTFTISSLGGIGGMHFTPIINAPEVAILGVSRTKIEPVWNGSEFQPAPMLPFSLSYDHRVIDGAEAARFTRYIAAALEDIRRLTI